MRAKAVGVRPGLTTPRWCTALSVAVGFGLGVCVTAPVQAQPELALNAQARRSVVLDREPTRTRFEQRLQAEIESVGFDVINADFSGPLEYAAEQHAAVAAVRLLPDGSGVEVWTSKATSGRSLVRQVIADDSPQGPDEGLIALQTAELLRTSFLLEPNTSPPAPRPREPAPVAPQDEPAKSRAAGREVALQAGLGPLYAPGGSSSALQFGVSLYAALWRNGGLALDLAAPLTPSRLSAPEGVASIEVYHAGATAVMELNPHGEWWYSTLGLGVGAQRIAASGKPTEPLVESSTSQVTGIVYARADLGAEPVAGLRVGGRVLAGSAFHRLQFRFAGNDAGEWGSTFLGAMVMVEARWR